ncbi:MAG: organic hydroperoxide resistance protein [Frankiaceae bacterium]|nr:organic hydroperoxide resistance protein [Frankiaceae bacterium]
MDILYTARATARGGRIGEVVSDDGVLDLELAYPKELGGPADNDKTNPEQLFAAGYSACFLNALKRVAKEKGLDAGGAEMTAEVGLGMAGAGFGLAVTLIGSLPALDAEQAQGLMEAAHHVCPYSNATRGNVEVTLATR